MEMRRGPRFLALAICAGFTALAFLDIGGFIVASQRGLLLFSNSVLPVLFPFFFITSLAVQTGASSRGHVMAFSLLGGFPTSARMLAELYEEGKITRERAIHMSTLTSFPSPIFIVATVGAGLLGDVRIGILAFVAIVIGALLNGIIYYRRLPKFDKKPQDIVQSAKHTTQDIGFSEAFSNALHSSVQAILLVGGLILIFFIVGSQLDSLLSLPPALDILLNSALEMTAGAYRLSALSVSLFVQLVLATAILAFSGICIGLQGFLFFKKFGMSMRFYFLYKATHTALSVGVSMILFVLFF